MIVDHIVGGLSSKASGVATVLTELTAAQSDLGIATTVFSTDCVSSGLRSVPVKSPVKSISPPGRWLGRLCYSPALRRELDSLIPQGDVVHIHSLWTMPNAYGSSLAKKHGKPVVFSPHGSLETWALNRHRWKKRICEEMFQRRDLEQANCVHALSHTEADSIRGYGLTNPIAVIPNGINLSAYENLPDRSVLLNSYPQLTDKRIVLFLSRLHPKKGLQHLVEAWRKIVVDNQDVQLVIAGPDNGHEAIIRGLVSDLELDSSVLFTGPLYGEQKLAALAAADLFVLPSFSEGFSMAILEAMACELPLLISRNCSFPEVANSEAGLECESDVTSTEEGLRKILSMTNDERQSMGRNGRKLVEQRYTWDRIAKQFLELYERVVNGEEA
ncbi:glycosyltransferase [Bythopirellula polymerisocia]|uniref:glycosyltransferase n=1 Tax=Bythopirellula polymerisocia TaxID=2528003 RepID=UPI001E4D3870|nr:glycosyltransferase [Bythopirellula polymerisocia]